MNIRRRTTCQEERGFTLLETLIYMLVAGVVLSFATLFFFQLVTTQVKSAAIAEVTRNARFALTRVTIELREAQQINFGASVFGSSPGTLSLMTSNPATDPTDFFVSGGALMIRRGVDAALPLTSSKVEVIDFTLEDLSTLDRTRAVRTSVTVRFLNTGALETFDATIVMSSTARLWVSDGFSVMP